MRSERPEQEPLANPRTDRVKAVARLSGRSARQRAGRFVVEGPQAVREAIALQVERLEQGQMEQGQMERGRLGAGVLRELYVTAEAAERYADLVAAAAGVGVVGRLVTGEVLAAMLGEAGTLSPQGVLAVCDLIGRPQAELAGVLARRPRLIAVLSQVRDPGNAGTVIRAADAAGADAVILSDSSVDVHNPKVVRATAGSLFHLPVIVGVPLVDAVAALRGAGLWILAADGAGELDLDRLSDDVEAPAGAGPGLSGAVGWVFGNEAWGLPAADRALADAVVRVPVHGRAESLNLATAATVCLYATARAQRSTARRAARPAGKSG